MSWLVLALYLVPLAGIAVLDSRTHRAPNRFVYPMIGLAVISSLTLYRDHAAEALLGGVVAFALLLVIAAVGRGRMGMGDVKYGIVCGIAVGVRGALPMLAFAFVAGAVVAVSVIALHLRRRNDSIAFTPFMFAGVLFALQWTRPYLIS